MKDKSYRVTVKVQNANLLRAIEQAGYSSVNKFAQKCGYDSMVLSHLINLKTSPIDKNGDLSEVVIKICTILNKEPKDLFNIEQMYMELDTNVSVFETDSEELKILTTYRSSNLSIQQALDAVFEKLTDKRAPEILRMRFGLEGEEHTLEEVGKHFNLSKDGIRRIQKIAIRQLRHPYYAKMIKNGMIGEMT